MKILLATDGLAAADAAEKLLVDLARRDHGIVVAAVGGARGAPDEDTAEDVAGRATERLRSAGFTVQACPLEGKPGEALARVVDAENIDLVVLGGGNRSWLGRVLFGDVSTQMLHSPVSVLIANDAGDPSGERPRVLVALDGSAAAAAGVDGAAAFLDRDRCSIELFLVVAVRVPAFSAVPATGYAVQGFDPELEEELMAGPRRDLEQRAEALAASGFEVTTKAILGSPVKRILEEASDTDARLVVVGARPRGALDRALVGSVSDQIARYSPAALVVRPTG